jgi:hypothetical protein
MTTVRTTPQNTSNVRSGRTARTLVGLSAAALTAFAPVAGVVDAAPSALLQQEGDGQEGDDAADGAPSVELGDRNELAAWWQDRLNEWLQLSGSERYPIPVDGWYGPMTQEATIAFQESTEAVEADGVVDPDDRVALREAIETLGDDTDDADGFGTASVTSDDFPASGDASLLQDVSVEQATDQEATDRLVFEFEFGHRRPLLRGGVHRHVGRHGRRVCGRALELNRRRLDSSSTGRKLSPCIEMKRCPCVVDS